MVKVIILNITPTQLIRQLILSNVLWLWLHFWDVEPSVFLIKFMKRFLLFQELFFCGIIMIVFIRVIIRLILSYFILDLLQCQFIKDHFVKVVIYIQKVLFFNDMRLNYLLNFWIIIFILFFNLESILLVDLLSLLLTIIWT